MQSAIDNPQSAIPWTLLQMAVMLDWGLHIADRLYPGRVPPAAFETVYTRLAPRGDSPSSTPLDSNPLAGNASPTGGAQTSRRQPAAPAQPEADAAEARIAGWTVSGRWEHGPSFPGATPPGLSPDAWAGSHELRPGPQFSEEPMNDMITSNDQIDDRWMAGAEDIARARGDFARCSECGSLDGMERWSPELLASLSPGLRCSLPLWNHPQPHEPGELYRPCPTCNSAGLIPPAYTPEAR